MTNEVANQNNPGTETVDQAIANVVIVDFKKSELVDPGLDDVAINKIVEHINGLAETSYYKTAVDIGDYILVKCFKDNPDFARSRNPNKAVSFNKLENHENLKIKPKQLSQFLNIAVQERFLVLNFTEEELKSLGYSHRVELLPIKDPKTTVHYTRKCIDDKWTVRQLRDEISQYLKGSTVVTSRLALITSGIENLVNDISVPEFKDNDFKLYSIDKLEKLMSRCDAFISNVQKVVTNVSKTKESIGDALEAKKTKEAEKAEKEANKQRKKAEKEAEEQRKTDTDNTKQDESADTDNTKQDGSADTDKDNKKSKPKSKGGADRGKK